ncbi:hypothetical protein [Azotosporobacter soli]|uniref:hypothetical protein n=1 Tax=Azotosporobacter soli TaxID=3055040 RepID=UPI0031FE6BE7
MKRFDRWTLKGFLYTLPLVIVYGIALLIFELEAAAKTNATAEFFYDLSGVVIGMMMLMALYLAARLLFSAAFREMVLMKLTFVPERDEREVQLSASAAKRTLLSTLALLLLLLCLSCFQIEVAPLPPEQMTNGQTKQLSLGINFQLLNNGPQKESGLSFISYTGLPLSASALIVGLLIWQVAVYNYMMRRLLKLGMGNSHDGC